LLRQPLLSPTSEFQDFIHAQAEAALRKTLPSPQKNGGGDFLKSLLGRFFRYGRQIAGRDGKKVYQSGIKGGIVYRGPEPRRERMPTSPITTFVQSLRRSALVRDGAGLTDGQLLTCFIERKDEAAFAALVQRHGPMVWGVCRRVVRSYHDAEDAFQATFLVLVRKAASVRPREMVGNWLHGVAYLTASRAMVATAKRRLKESQPMEMPEPEVAPKDLWSDLQTLLDQELSRLPEKYRRLIVLCDLEGQTRKAVAQQLGCPEGTVAGRLARARTILARRLTQRGVGLSGGLLAAVLARNGASAGVPNSVVSSTIQAANLLAADGVISAQVAELTKGVMKTMLMTRLKNGAAVLLVIALLGIGVIGISMLPAWGQAAKPPVQSKASQSPSKQESKPKAGHIFFWRQQSVGNTEPHLARVSPEGKSDTRLTKDLKKGTFLSPSSVAVSPDGRLVAYGVVRTNEADDNGSPSEEVFVKAIGDDKPGESLKLRGNLWCWSPDSRSLVVNTIQGTAISHEIVDLKTKKAKSLQLPEGLRGHLITDRSKNGEWFLTTLFAGQKSKPFLCRVKRDGSEVLKIREGGLGKFSPDGQAVLYMAPGKETIEDGQLFIVGLKGGRPKRISKELNGSFRGHCWSPDGKQIAYVWQRHAGDGQECETFLMVVDADGQKSTVVITEKSAENCGSLASPNWR
jgi:RNA polymerase sigma factor (sigma-70 family)